MSSRLRAYPSPLAYKEYAQPLSKSSTYMGSVISDMRYDAPVIPDMAIVMAFFNPGKSFRIIQNLYTIKQMLELSDIPFYVGEIAYNDVPFVLKNGPNIYQYRTSSLMFYKENLMTQVIKKLPESFTKVLILDADIVFLDADWYNKVSQALNTHNVIQPFYNALQLNMTYGVEHTKQTVFAPICTEKPMHEGYAWAFQRKWLEEHPLFEYAIVGDGDTVLWNSVMNVNSIDPIYQYDKEHIVISNPSCSYVNVNIAHLPHGAQKKRNYDIRTNIVGKIMKMFKITKLSDMLYRSDDGVFEWNIKYRDLINAEFVAYFKDREDDGI